MYIIYVIFFRWLSIHTFSCCGVRFFKDGHFLITAKHCFKLGSCTNSLMLPNSACTSALSSSVHLRRLVLPKGDAGLKNKKIKYEQRNK